MIFARRSFASPALALALAACATSAPPVAVTPDAIPALEAAVAANPGSADTLTLLGAAYQAAGRHEDAARTLARAVERADAPPVAQLYLGLANESLERWQQAREAYAAYLDAGTGDDDVRADVERRVALVDRALVDQAARAMIEREDELSALAPEPRSVAVLPFRVLSDDARFAPLQAALADMVTTDLSTPGVLTLIERAQIQAIVREMALDLAGYTEAGTGARVGRLMRAGHVVQGSVDVLPDEQVHLQAALLDAVSRERTGGADERTALAQILDAEKALVFAVLDALGVTLTPAERERIEENRTANLVALLAYGDGLMAMDRGDFAGAAEAFGRAADADPSFEPAQAGAQQAADLQVAAATTPAELAFDAAPELPAGDAPDARELVLGNVTDFTNPNPGAQYTGDDRDTRGVLDGLTEPDDRQEDETAIVDPPSAGIDIPIPNPTRP